MDLKKENALVQRAKNDPEAFSHIYDEHYPRIFHYVLKRVRDLQVAQDIASEVFLKAFKNLWQFRFRNIPFSAWLYRIASNEISSYLKKHFYKTVSLDELLQAKGFEPAAEEDIVADLQAQEALEASNKVFFEMQEIISNLPSKLQTILNLKFFEKKSFQEISQIMNMKEGTVKSSLFRGLEKLRKFMS